MNVKMVAASILGIATMLACGCATSETAAKPETAGRVVKSTPPRPVPPVDVRNEEPAIPAAAQAAPAAPATAPSPDVITLPASMGAVAFPHRKHQEMQNGCNACHAQAPGRIAEMGKEWAHTTCKGCHAKMKAGPTSCNGCHKK